jgi:hypothetical protein
VEAAPERPRHRGAAARGRRIGDWGKLTAAQEKQIRGLIADNLPEQLKLSFALWIRKVVDELL